MSLTGTLPGGEGTFRGRVALLPSAALLVERNGGDGQLVVSTGARSKGICRLGCGGISGGRVHVGSGISDVVGLGVAIVPGRPLSGRE